MKLTNIYRRKVGGRGGVDVWAVDGARVRQEFYTDFVMGGHDGRYRFIPPKEVWIDNTLSCAELDYLIEHEMFERKLMVEDGLNYNDAHDRATEVEEKMRTRDREESDRKEAETIEVEKGTWFTYGKNE